MKKIIIMSALLASFTLQTSVSEAVGRYPHHHSKHHKGHKHKSRKSHDPAYQN